MTASPPPTQLPHRHSIDSPYSYQASSSASRSSPSSLLPNISQPHRIPPHSQSYSGAGTLYGDRRTSLDGDYREGERRSSTSSSSSSFRPSQTPPTQPRSSSSSSSSNIFTRKLLKKNRTNSNTSKATSPATTSPPLAASNFTSSPPIASPMGYPSQPNTYFPSNQPSYSSPYPPISNPEPPPGASYSSPRRSFSSNYQSPYPAVEEAEETQLARIRQESVEYEQQRLLNLEAEEDRRFQRALAESSRLAEEEQRRAEERARLQRMEEEIAMREAIVFSREYEQAQAERLAREGRRRTLEEEKEVQQVLARSRTIVSQRDSSVERREREAFEMATRLSLDDNEEGRWETGSAGTSGQAFDRWSRRDSTTTTQETTVEDYPSSSPQDQAGYNRTSNPDPPLAPIALARRPNSSFVVTNPDRSGLSDSEEEDVPPPAYTIIALESNDVEPDPSMQQASSALPPDQSPLNSTSYSPELDASYPPISSSITPFDTSIPAPFTSPLPPPGASPSHFSSLPSHLTNTNSLDRNDSSRTTGAYSTTPSVGSYETITPSLFHNIAVEDSVAEQQYEGEDEGGGEEEENPFDDHFAADQDETHEDPHQSSIDEPRNDHSSRSPSLHLPAADSQQAQPPILVDTAASPPTKQSPPSPESNVAAIDFPSSSFLGLPSAPSPLRRVSEPPPSTSSLLPAPSPALAQSHSATNTPEPSPSLDSYPHSPSFGGVVQDSSTESFAAGQYVLDGMRWGFVAIERASMHPPLDSKGEFPRGAQLSTAENEEGKKAFVSFAIEAKSWDALLVYLMWYGKSRIEASPHDHGVDELGNGHQVSIRVEFFRSFLDSSCRVRCRIDLLPLSQGRLMSQDIASTNSSNAETTPSFDSDCPTVHILLAHRPRLPLTLANLATILSSALAYSRHQNQRRGSTQSASSASVQQGYLAEAVDFLKRLDGTSVMRHDDGDDSDDVGWTNKIKSRLRKKKVRTLKTDNSPAGRNSVLPEGAMMITPFSAD